MFCSPERPISECQGRVLPAILYPFIEGANAKRGRSFGQLNLLHVADDLATVKLAASDKDSTSDNGSLATTDVTPDSSDESIDTPLAEKVLRKEWDRRAAQGLFRYDVTECESKVRAREHVAPCCHSLPMQVINARFLPDFVSPCNAEKALLQARSCAFRFPDRLCSKLRVLRLVHFCVHLHDTAGPRTSTVQSSEL